MSQPDATADLRWSRAAVVALVATTIGVVAHVGAGGLMPGVGVLLAVVGCLVVLSAAALGRPASYVALAALVGGGQTVVHLVLTATSGHAGAHRGTAAGGSAPAATRVDGGNGGVREALTAATGAPRPGATSVPGAPHWLEHLRDDLTGANLAMAVAHLAAAGVVAWWLFVGEQAVWTLVALLGAQVLLRPGWGSWLTDAGSGPGDRPEPPTTGTITGSRACRQRMAANGPTGRRGPPRPTGLLQLAPTT